MKKLLIGMLAITGLVWGCTDVDINTKKQTFVYTKVAGEYSVDLVLTGAAEFSDHQHILIYNTASSNDSLWVEDRDFYDSKVEVAWDGKNTFSVTEGKDLAHGETVNITGEFFPDKDSVHVEWRYLQGGDPADDYVVSANGSVYTGLKGD